MTEARLALPTTLALGEGGELVFRPPGPLAHKETKFLCNRNVSRSTTSVANCCGAKMNVSSPLTEVDR